MRPMYGQFGGEMAKTRYTFVSKAAADLGIKEKYGLESNVYAVNHVRQLTKKDMVRNTATPHIEVDPETFYVTVNGELAYVAPAPKLALSQLYWFS